MIAVDVLIGNINPSILFLYRAFVKKNGSISIKRDMIHGKEFFLPLN